MKILFRGALCALLLTICAVLASCGAAQPTSASFQAMDTLMSLKVYGGNPDTCDKLQNRIEALDASLDATDENSEIYRLNTEKTAAVSEDTAYLLHETLSLCDDFKSAFDLTVYPAVQAWGFNTGDYRVPDEAELKSLAKKINYRTVRYNDRSFSLDDGVQIDLGAVAKGFAADECRDILCENNAQAAVLNLGGTIMLFGEKPDKSRFTVGVTDPDNPAAYFGTLECDQCTVSTSGGYERYFEKDGKRYIHILDPKTAAPADNGILSVTIISDSGTLADAASTALFVMGLGKATEYYQSQKAFDFIILTEGHNLYITENIYDDFTLGNGYDYTVHKVSERKPSRVDIVGESPSDES